MLFHLYGGNGVYQWIAMLAVLAGLILLNEFARRTKFGGLMMFGIIPLALTVYFIVIAVCAGQGIEWAVNNQTHLYMNGWFHYAKLYAALAGCIGFMMIKYEWGIGKKQWFRAFPFVIVAINILIAVARRFRSATNGWYSWWLSSEDVWLYGGWHNVRRNRRNLKYPLHDRLVESIFLQRQEGICLAGYDLGLHCSI